MEVLTKPDGISPVVAVTGEVQPIAEVDPLSGALFDMAIIALLLRLSGAMESIDLRSELIVRQWPKFEIRPVRERWEGTCEAGKGRGDEGHYCELHLAR